MNDLPYRTERPTLPQRGPGYVAGLFVYNRALDRDPQPLFAGEGPLPFEARPETTWQEAFCGYEVLRDGRAMHLDAEEPLALLYDRETYELIAHGGALHLQELKADRANPRDRLVHIRRHPDSIAYFNLIARSSPAPLRRSFIKQIDDLPGRFGPHWEKTGYIVAAVANQNDEPDT